MHDTGATEWTDNRMRFCYGFSRVSMGFALALTCLATQPGQAQIAATAKLPWTQGEALAELTEAQLRGLGFPQAPTDLTPKSFDTVFARFIAETRPGAQGLPGVDIVGRVRSMLAGPELEALPECGRKPGFVGPEAVRIDLRQVPADGQGNPPFSISRWVFFAEGCGTVRLISLFVLDREDGQFRVNVLPVDHSLIDLRLLSSIMPEMLAEGQKGTDCQEVELEMARPFAYRRAANPARFDWSELWVLSGCGRQAGFRLDLVQQGNGGYRHQVDSVPLFQK